MIVKITEEVTENIKCLLIEFLHLRCLTNEKQLYFVLTRLFTGKNVLYLSISGQFLYAVKLFKNMMKVTLEPEPKFS